MCSTVVRRRSPSPPPTSCRGWASAGGPWARSSPHHRLLDAKELLGKIATLTALVLILTVVYGLLLAWVGSDRLGIFFFNTVVASFVVLVLFDQLRTRVEAGINRWMFAERYAFSLRLQQLAQALANIIEVRQLVSRILTELENSARVTHCSIYLADPAGARYRLAGHLGQRPIEELDTTTRRLFFERLRQQGMLNLETLELDLADQVARNQEGAVATRNIVATLQEQFATVCIPLISEDQLLGLLNLRDDRLREAYASDEVAQLRRVATQAAITLRNSQIYEEMKERERLAALGQMAAGLAHEIRNPLGAIKGAAQLLEPSSKQRPSDAESDEFLEIIVEEVDRLDRVVTQFLGYARPDGGQREPLSVNEVLHKTLQLVRSQKAETIELRVALARNSPPSAPTPSNCTRSSSTWRSTRCRRWRTAASCRSAPSCAAASRAVRRPSSWRCVSRTPAVGFRRKPSPTSSSPSSPRKREAPGWVCRSASGSSKTTRVRSRSDRCPGQDRPSPWSSPPRDRRRRRPAPPPPPIRPRPE
jgi:hypothetical protein